MSTLGFVGLGHMVGNMAAGYEHRDIAALFEVLAQLTSER